MKIITGASPKKEQTILIAVILLFHLVGLAGFAIQQLRPLFLSLVPGHLVLMLLVIIISHKPVSSNFLLFVLLLFAIGLTAEWIGVHKKWLFGNYTYGDTLGVKLGDIPLTIGINWFLLIYAAGVLMQQSRIRSVIARVITGALLLVLLDVIIEQVATRFGYWQWANGIVPFKNYACWFLLSGLMLFIFESFGFKKQSIVAPVLLVVQFVFFIVLNFL